VPRGWSNGGVSFAAFPGDQLLSHQGVSIEEIARLVGHATTRTTEIVYRRELRPVITTATYLVDDFAAYSPNSARRVRCSSPPGLPGQAGSHGRHTLS
jgi:hypothetical protein